MFFSGNHNRIYVFVISVNLNTCNLVINVLLFSVCVNILDYSFYRQIEVDEKQTLCIFWLLDVPPTVHICDILSEKPMRLKKMWFLEVRTRRWIPL